jgi:hypothetical protein
VATVRKQVEALFPKTCSKCARVFRTYADYARIVTPIGAPLVLDAKEGEAQTVFAVGMANCVCGTTLSIGSKGPLLPGVSITDWAKVRAAREGITVEQLFMRMRTRLRAEALRAAEAIAHPVRDSSL